jgi:carboxymethylenebutenolidase
VQFHFGEKDSSIPAEAVEAHRKALPGYEIYTYPAGHAFDRAVDPHAYGAASSKLALERALAFFDKQLGGA